jgi:hypothetical protein
MVAYKNHSGESGVTHYEIGDDYINVKFKGKSDIYTYSYSRSGKHHIDTMKKLAIKGLGLSTYISQNSSVKNNYDKR